MTKIIDSTNLGYLISKIKAAFWSKNETTEVSIDDTPTSGSNNLVKSGGVYTAVNAKYTKPSTGIPASDLATGVIPDVSNFITNSVNNLTNYYLKSETYTKSEVEGLIAAINQFHYEIAASTSAVSSPASNVLYLIGPNGSGADKYEEYVYASSTWTKIGDTSIDLSGYVTTQALNTALADYTTTANLTTLLSGKADKVTSATNGHLVGLDSNGNLTDSGLGIDDIPTANSNNVVKSGGIYEAIIHPQLAYKLFDNPFASTSSWTVHCFMSMRSSNWSKIYTIRFRIKAWIPNVNNSTAISDITLQVYCGVVKAYYIKNAIANTDYRPYYDLYFYGATETGYDAGASDFVGVRINTSTYSYTTKRNYEIQVITADECTFSIFDNDKNSTEAKGNYSASANYNSGTQFNTYTSGLQETSDTNTTYSVISDSELRTGTATTGRTVSAARLKANYSITTDAETGEKTINIAGQSAAIPASIVQDVTVGGSSVVSNGIAAVPSIPDAVTGNPTVPFGTTPTTFTRLKIGNSYYELPTDIAYIGEEEDEASYIDSGTIIDVSTKADKVVNGTDGNFAAIGNNGNFVDSGHKHSDYQAVLVSGTNIKTINNESILGSGNITIQGGSGGGVSSVAMTVPTGLSVTGSPITTSGTLAVSLASGYSIPTTAKQTQWDNKQAALVSGTNIKTINNQSLLGSGNITISGGSGEGGSVISWNQKTSTGVNIASITIDGSTTEIYAPSGGGNGDSISWNQKSVSGTNIAAITINGTTTQIYAPTGSSVSWGTAGSDYVPLTVNGTTKNVLTSHQSLTSITNVTNNIKVGGNNVSSSNPLKVVFGDANSTATSDPNTLYFLW